MPRYNEIAGTSAGAGFQYYDVQPFNFTKAGGIFLPKFTGTYSHNTSLFTLPKNRLGKVLTSQIMTNIQVNIDKTGFDVSFSPGQFRLLAGNISDSVQIGTSGGFPIFYRYVLNVSNDANNLIFSLDVGNPSGVNDVTSQSITFQGQVFFYLAPF